MPRSGWVGDVKKPGRLTEKGAPWELFVDNDHRKARQAFPTEREALDAARQLVDSAEGNIGLVQVCRAGVVVHTVIPDINVPRGTSVQLEGTSLRFIVQGPHQDGQYVVAGAVNLRRNDRGDIVVVLPT